MVTNLAEGAEHSAAVAVSAPGVTLHAAVTGAGAPVVLLHGLFGMGSNLGALARALQDSYAVHQLDLPNHGRSGWTDAMTLGDLADAVGHYIARVIGAPAIVIGHSLGGKVAMQLALSQPARVAALVVADIAPVDYPGTHEAVFAAIDAVIRAKPASRREAAALMREYLDEEGVVQFLSLSLHPDAQKAYVWRFNAPALRANYAALRAAPSGTGFAGPALFISGALSNYVDARGVAAARALFPAASFTVLEGTGHWLHAERAEDFNSAVQAFLVPAVLPETTAPAVRTPGAKS